MTTISLPSPGPEIRQGYLHLVGEIDTEIERISAGQLKNLIQCRPGCFECCVNFSVFPLEAALLSEEMHEIGELIVNKDDLCRCLKDTCCSIYPIRPIICRTQGIPLGYIDELSGSVEISACQNNFSDSYQFQKYEILFMDDFNQRLAELNIQYCQEMKLEPFNRVPICGLLPATRKDHR